LPKPRHSMTIASANAPAEAANTHMRVDCARARTSAIQRRFLTWRQCWLQEFWLLLPFSLAAHITITIAPTHRLPESAKHAPWPRTVAEASRSLLT
jgi:hypothetical protein